MALISIPEIGQPDLGHSEKRCTALSIQSSHIDTGVSVTLAMPPAGDYVWWAQPKVQFGLSLGDVGGAFKSLGNTFFVEPAITSTAPWTILEDEVVLSDIYSPDTDAYLANLLRIMQGEVPGLGDQIIKMTLDVKSLKARRDTYMLDLGWGNTNNRWDEPHLNTYERDDEEKSRCWAVASQMLNHYYGGTLTQDEIKYHVMSPGRRIENHFPHGNDGYAGPLEASMAVAYALNIEQLGYVLDPAQLVGVPSFVGGFFAGWGGGAPPPATIIAAIETDRPLIVSQSNHGWDRSHMMVINGYSLDSKGNMQIHLLNTDNEGCQEWRPYATIVGIGSFAPELSSMLKNALADAIEKITSSEISSTFRGASNYFYYAYYVPPAKSNTNPRDMDARLDVQNDYDGDGILTFDEEERFGTDPRNADSDGDGVRDKSEIGYYLGRGVNADIDGDGLRAELDPDSDGDGDCDGDENDNGDYVFDEDQIETNAMDPHSVGPEGERRCRSHLVALLAQEKLQINDRAVCSAGFGVYCPVAALGKNVEKAVELGVAAQSGTVLSGGAVWLRNRSTVHGNIRSLGAVDKQDGARVSGIVNEMDESLIPQIAWWNKSFQVANNPGIELGLVSRVPTNTMEVLPSGTYSSRFVVESGATLLLQPGHYSLEGLEVQAGGVVILLGSSAIELELRRDLIWKGRFFESNLSKVAKRLRVTVYGDSDLYLEGAFAGQLSAPNAHVIVGQAAKEHAGQIQAKRITMHQGSHFQWVRWGL